MSKALSNGWLVLISVFLIAFLAPTVQAQGGQANFSSEYSDLFQRLDAAVNTERGDIASAKRQFPALLALTVSPDEKNATGALIYNAGAKTGDVALQLQGMKLMLESGKVPPENVGRFNFIVYQLANAQRQFAESRAFLQKAIDANFSADNVSVSDMQVAMAESFIAENRFSEGLDYLSNAIEGRKAAGQPVDEAWYRRGVSVAYNNVVVPQVYDFVSNWVAAYPSKSNWRDAINIALNLSSFEPDEIFELVLLASNVDARLEGETLARAARAQQNGAVNVTGRNFLTSGNYSAAEATYLEALENNLDGDPELLMRLGIAQAQQGKANEALVTFASISGRRYVSAQLWSAYVAQKYNRPTPSPSRSNFQIASEQPPTVASEPLADKCIELGFLRGTANFNDCMRMLGN